MPNRYSRSSGFVRGFLVSNEPVLKKVLQHERTRRKHGVATPVFPCLHTHAILLIPTPGLCVWSEDKTKTPTRPTEKWFQTSKMGIEGKRTVDKKYRSK